MKIVCISNVLDDYIIQDLVVGEIYEALEDPRVDVTTGVYHLVGEDPNDYTFYSAKLFKRLDELREDKLKELGI